MLSIALALAAASVAEQMAPAKQGLLQCQLPDVLFKTCFSLSTVHEVGPSTYMFEIELAMDAQVTARMKNQAFVRGSNVCDVINVDDARGATFTSGGRPVSAAKAAAYRSKLRGSFAVFSGKTVCTHIVPGEQGVEMVAAIIDGKRLPAADYPMKWVAPKDGWKVAP